MIEHGRPSIWSHHPRPDGFEIAREVELGDRLAVTGIGPKRLVGLRDQHAHDDGLSRLEGLAFGARAGVGIGDRRISGRRRLLGFDLGRRLVFAQPLEGRLPDHAVAGPAGEFDLGDEFRLQPIDVRSFRGAPIPVNGDLVACHRLQPWQQLLDLGLAVSGTDAADIDEMLAAMHADQ